MGRSDADPQLIPYHTDSVDDAAPAGLSTSVESGHARIRRQIDSVDLSARRPPRIAPLQRIMQDIVVNLDLGGRCVRERRPGRVRPPTPLDENLIIDDVDERQAEVTPSPHGTRIKAGNENRDVVVVDVALSSVPRRQPLIVHQIIARDARVLEAQIEDIGDLDRS